MSLQQLTASFRGVVMSQFLDHCRGKSLNIDPEVLDMLVKSFIGDEVDFTKFSKPSMEKTKNTKKTKKTKKTQSIPEEFKRMPVINSGKCMSRTFASGWGIQCSRSHAPDEEFCKTHLKGLNAECIPIWGRIDEPRRRLRADNGVDCCWKEFKGDGDIEDTSEESQVICTSPTPSQSSVSSNDKISMNDNVQSIH